MSNWVHLLGNIQIHGIKKEGIKKMYNLKTKKDIEEFYSSSNNWKHTYTKREHLLGKLKIDYRKDVVKLINELDKPTGSEGGIEFQVCFYDQQYKIWGGDGSSSETRDYNPKTGELIPFGYSVGKEEFERDGWECVWFESRGEYFVLCVFGALRDRDLKRFKKEFESFIKTLDKYFILDDINARAHENWRSDYEEWSYDNLNDKIFCREVKDNVRR